MCVLYFPVINEDLSVAVEVSDAQLVEGDVLVQLERRLLLGRGRRVERPHPVCVLSVTKCHLCSLQL